MKFFITILLTALLSFAACLYLPWWVVAIISFAIAFAIPQRAIMAFLAGFIALFLLWGGLSFFISQANAHLLAHKLSLLIIKTDSPALIILVTAIIGGIVAGFAGLSGRLFRKVIWVQKK